ncbi:MAG: asparagine synthase (glutamine-hydrolyzing) [Sediminibacterium sp. Gen4]|jgi:asparagine synthase (glutamine-hydrolysing)|uniref:asparagine synthase (glutamine-hydrolyzing) n=1 Tax=unclassified Sediminibacterium TaxID=2635961 RepID=UPI0015B9AA7A|nr:MULTISPECIES: asparagine synthase (glutamine-hydrolyzing) [unclassified Sediminibacterium]MBW0163716.1 asparagine synthase (glutamine-hydrolyzing) [Sediminibacterium sp.]NWK66934.1 asparagine synthase (glutamine-hydrolyzing) [Sediminibacterium sp. Gen4]
MCGIVGGIGNIQGDTGSILELISHRGPDSSGYYVQQNFFLGHTRLAIQDLSENGNQPMFSTDNRYVIIFNGEIYNHHEIRTEIKEEFDFRSSGDTETVLNAYIKYGISFLNRLNGIFAFAIYDKKEDEILIARDQFGVKPLYIYQDDDILLFGSEIKTFLPSTINKELSPAAFTNYLEFLWSPGELTPFTYVKKLLPGHCLKFKLSDYKNAKSVKYYQWIVPEKSTDIPENTLVDILEEKLLKAVDRQMLSDVPVGFFLSGGLDSSLLVAIARKLYPDRKFTCFTIDVGNWGAGIEDFADDLQYAKKVAETLQVDLKIIKADIDIVQMFDKMIWHLDEPQADAAPLNVLNIAQLARENGIKVLIGGAGGDDIFSGYRRHQALRYEKYFQRLPIIFRKLIQLIVQQFPSNKPLFRRIKKILSAIDKSPLERQAGYFGWLPTDVVKSLFSEEWKIKLNHYDPYDYFYQLAKQLPEDSDVLSRMLYWELKTFLVDHNLNYTDKMAMAVGVEARVPYLDMELVAFSKIIPSDLKMKGKEAKYILKKVAERYLPMDVIYRPKTGFGAPVRQWITKDLQPMIEDRLSPDRLRKRGIFDAEKVWDLIEANKAGKIDASYSIWSLLAIESWLTQFVDADKYS